MLHFYHFVVCWQVNNNKIWKFRNSFDFILVLQVPTFLHVLNLQILGWHVFCTWSIHYYKGLYLQYSHAVRKIPVNLSICRVFFVSLKIIRKRCTTLCDKICQWHTTGRWFSPASSTNKTYLTHIFTTLFKIFYGKRDPV